MEPCDLKVFPTFGLWSLWQTGRHSALTSLRTVALAVARFLLVPIMPVKPLCQPSAGLRRRWGAPAKANSGNARPASAVFGMGSALQSGPPVWRTLRQVQIHFNV